MSFFNSLRGRLAVTWAVIIVAVLTLSGFGLGWLFQNYIERRVGQELESRVLDLAGLFDVDQSGAPVITRVPADPRYGTPYSGAYWYVREGQAFVLRSRSLWDAGVTGAGVAGLVAKGIGPSQSDVYVLERPITLGEDSKARSFLLGVALDQAEVRDLSREFRTELIKGLALVGALLFAAAWAQAGYGLKPLTTIRRQLSDLHHGAKEKLDGPFPAEIEPLAQDLNTLFARQREMIGKARDRAGSLAHGLKTPMTVLYGEARKLEREGRGETAAFIRSQLDAMHKQVERELSRARAHGETAGLGLQADVSATAARLVELMKRMPRGDVITWELPPPRLRAAIDADDLGEVMGNLLDNARKWAASRVTISAVEKDDHLHIAIADDGPGIADEDRARFLGRGEGAGGSSGLGLSIVAELLAPHGAQLTLAEREGGGLVVGFAVPVAG